MVETVTLKDAQVTYALDEAQLGAAPLVIERAGRPVAAVVPLDEYREFIAWREQRRAIAPDPALAQFRADHEAFLRLRPELLTTHRGRYVAILNGEMVDSDADKRVLARRVYGRYGYRAIYMGLAEESERVVRIPGPRMAR